MIHHVKDLTEGIFFAGVISGLVVTLIIGGLVHLVRKPFRKNKKVTHDDQGYIP